MDHLGNRMVVGGAVGGGGGGGPRYSTPPLPADTTEASGQIFKDDVNGFSSKGPTLFSLTTPKSMKTVDNSTVCL